MAKKKKIQHKLITIPKEWINCPLKQVVVARKGRKPQILSPEKVQDFIPYLDIKAIEKGTIDNYADPISSVLTTENDLLIVWDGARSGWVGKSRVGAVGSTLASLTPIIIEKDYLFYFLQSQFKFLNSNIKGTGIPHVNPDILWDLNIPLPPLNEQKRIAIKLDELINKLKQSQELLEQIPEMIKIAKQKVLISAITGALTRNWRKNKKYKSIQKTLSIVKASREKLAKNDSEKDKIEKIYSLANEENRLVIPDSWKFVRLEKLATGFVYGSSSKSENKGNVVVLRMGNIQDGIIDWSDLKYSSNKNEIKKYLLKKNDILFNRTNSPALVGKTAIYKGEKPAIFAGYLIKIKYVSVLNPEYLNIILNSPFGREWCYSAKTDAVSQSNINAQKLAKFEIPFCSPEEQKEIVKQTKRLMHKLNDLLEKSKALQKQQNAIPDMIIDIALSGKLVERNSEDESAILLLERIKKERIEYLKKEIEIKKSRKIKPINYNIMSEKSILEILQEARKPLLAKDVWEKSIHKDSIEEFYSELKKLIDEKKKVIDIKKKRDTYLTLTK